MLVFVEFLFDANLKLIFLKKKTLQPMKNKAINEKLITVLVLSDLSTPIKQIEPRKAMNMPIIE